MAKNKQLRLPVPRWQASYKKKMRCDLCGFKARLSRQILVFHIDGNLNHCDATNLRSVCRNCAETVGTDRFTWRLGDLEPDF